MRHSIFLMAAGNSSRWKKLKKTSSLPDVKQLIPIFGKPLITHTANRLRYLNKEFTLVTANKDIVSACKPCHVMAPRSGRQTLLTNILNTQHLWKGVVTFLLGDVIYTDHAMTLALKGNVSDYMFYGGPFETYALTINSITAQKIITAIEKVSMLPSQYSGWIIRGCLRDLRWMLYLGRVPARPFDEFGSRVRDKHFQMVLDWTCDIDHEFSYNRFMRDERVKGVMPMKSN